MYKLSKSGLLFLLHSEGYVPRVYKDRVGLLTGGVGHLLEGTRKPNDAEWTEGEPLTQKQVMDWLAQDVARFVGAVQRFEHLSQNQVDALVSIAFNCGEAVLHGTGLEHALEAGDTDAVCAEMQRWNKAGGKVDVGLTRRRRYEAVWFRTPDESYAAGGKLCAFQNFAQLDTDGIMGPETKKSIETYQRRVGLPVTGTLNQELMTRLKVPT